MPSEIVIFKKDIHALPEEKKKVVEQGDSKIILFSEDDSPDVLLYTKGLNPCMGIIIKGKVMIDYEGESSEDYFVILNHHQDSLLKKSIDPIDLQKQIQRHAEETIASILSSIFQEPSLLGYDDSNIKIIISNCFLIRCQQSDLKSSQELMATEFKKILQSKSNFLKVIDDNDMNILLSKKYNLHIYEVPEAKTADYINCYIKKEKDRHTIKVFVKNVIDTPKQTGMNKRKLFYSSTTENTFPLIKSIHHSPKKINKTT